MPTSDATEHWFFESDIPGKRSGRVRHGLLIDRLIYEGVTPYQKIMIFRNPTYGRVLCLDDIVQFSESDEFVYHEMIVHPLLFSHPKPENILIIGGGDGGALKQVLKHPVRRVDLVEIDREVIAVSKTHLKFVSENAFSDKRVAIHHLSGQDFLKKCDTRYDVIIVDCTNSGENAMSNALYATKFYRQADNVLNNDGMLITLGSALMDFDGGIKPVLRRIGTVFPFSQVLRFCMASYHCGEYAFIIGSRTIDLKQTDPGKLYRRFVAAAESHAFAYYSPDMHRAGLALPPVLTAKIKKMKQAQ
jgi:spermidine synthase